MCRQRQMVGSGVQHSCSGQISRRRVCKGILVRNGSISRSKGAAAEELDALVVPARAFEQPVRSGVKLLDWSAPRERERRRALRGPPTLRAARSAA